MHVALHPPSAPRVAFLRGLLVGTAPLALLVSALVHGASPADVLRTPPPPWVMLALLAATILVVGAIAVDSVGAPRRGIIWLALAGFLASVLPATTQRPMASLALVIAAAGIAAVASYASAAREETHAFEVVRSRAPALGALSAAVVAWLITIGATAEDARVLHALAAISIAVSLVATGRWLTQASIPRAWQRILGIAAVLACLLIAGTTWPSGRTTLTWALLGAAAPLLVVRLPLSPSSNDPSSTATGLLDHPARLLVGTFAALGTIGAFVLALPAAARDPHGVAPIDAVFTSFSACCVTGLAVLDTPGDFSVVGQVVILVLIQLGGLGIMTFSTAAFALLGRRPSLRHEAAVTGLIGAESRADLHRAVRRILVVTFVAEALGAVLLTILFARSEASLASAAWRGVFTAISAFCNAGFALQSDSLIGYQDQPLVLHAIAAMIVIGSLGPVVIGSLPALARRKRAPLFVQLTLVSSAFLLVVPALLIGRAEWHGSLEHLSELDRAHNAWFQSVTLRTAGFNSIDFTKLTSASAVLMMSLMFIGGASGSTAGGVKIGTAAILFLAVVAVLRGEPEIRVFGRRVPHATVYRAAAIVTLAAACTMLGWFALMLTHPMDPLRAAFEVFSAVGTVGLSLGGTAELDEVGKIIVILLMFAGRVGPLSLFLVFAGGRRSPGWDMPEEEVAVG